MGVYIKGMQMPKSCNACMFDVYGLCLINKNLKEEDNLTHSCPLIPVPDHGDLIDRDLAVQDLRMDYAYAAAKIVALQPTIIPADREGEA